MGLDATSLSSIGVGVNGSIDLLEAALVENFTLIDCPLKHRFADGMYIREIFMPKSKEGMDTIVTSLIHKTTHPFVVLKGKVLVYSENDGQQLIEAPYIGMTTPNTRRVLRIIEDTVWVTFHATKIKPKDDSEKSIKKAVDLISSSIIEEHENTLLGGVVKNNVLVKKLNKKSLINHQL